MTLLNPQIYEVSITNCKLDMKKLRISGIKKLAYMHVWRQELMGNPCTLPLNFALNLKMLFEKTPKTKGGGGGGGRGGGREGLA